MKNNSKDYVYLILKYTVAESNQIEFKKYFELLQHASQKELGCLVYFMTQSEDTPNIFTLIEIWENKHSLDAHKVSAHVSLYKDVIGALVDSVLREDLQSIF